MNQPSPDMFKTVVLLHRTEQGNHYDWLMEDPNRKGEEHSLWAARVQLPPTDWLIKGRFPIEPIAAHRGIYLTYEGDISGNRGSVERVAEGMFQVIQWEEFSIQIHLQLADIQHAVTIKQSETGHWLATIGEQ